MNPEAQEPHEAYARWKDFLRAICGLGIFALCLNGLAYHVDPDPKWGWVGGFGLGAILSFPYLADRFSWWHKYKLSPQPTGFWAIVDLAWRVAIIVCVEFALRHMDLRYSFKSSMALGTLLVMYNLWPALPKDAEKSVVDDKIFQIQAFMIGAIGVCILLGAYMTTGHWLIGWSAVVGTVGIALIITETNILWLGDPQSNFWPIAIGLIGTTLATLIWFGLGVAAGCCLTYILTIGIYFVIIILAGFKD